MVDVKGLLFFLIIFWFNSLFKCCFIFFNWLGGIFLCGIWMGILLVNLIECLIRDECFKLELFW